MVFLRRIKCKISIKCKIITVTAFKVLVIASLVIGSLIDPSFVWELADLTVAIMALPNIIALVLLGKEARDILEDYDIKLARNMLNWKYEYQDE